MSSATTLRRCISFSWIRHFPNTASGVVQGCGGQAMLWKFLALWTFLEDGKKVVEGIQFFWWGTCVTMYGCFVIMFTIKAVLYPEVVKAEVKHPVRFNFFCGPILALCMLMIAMPPAFGRQIEVLQTMWIMAFLCQAAASLVIYHRWLVSTNVHETAAAPYLLSVISWFYLSLAGTPADIDSALGLPLRAVCIGVGSFFSVFTYPFILSGIYGGRTPAGTPASFQLLAPPSIVGISIMEIKGGYSSAIGSLFGCVVFLFCLLVRMGPQILAPPRLIGVNWTYVAPQAAMAMLAIKIAEHLKSTMMNTIALILSSCALLVIIAVAIRLGVHAWQVIRGKDVWQDPLAVAILMNPRRTNFLFSQKSFCSPAANIEASYDVDCGSERSGNSIEDMERRKPSETLFNGPNSTNSREGTDGATMHAAVMASAAATATAAHDTHVV